MSATLIRDGGDRGDGRGEQYGFRESCCIVLGGEGLYVEAVESEALIFWPASTFLDRSAVTGAPVRDGGVAAPVPLPLRLSHASAETAESTAGCHSMSLASVKACPELRGKSQSNNNPKKATRARSQVATSSNVNHITAQQGSINCSDQVRQCERHVLPHYGMHCTAHNMRMHTSEILTQVLGTNLRVL